MLDLSNIKAFDLKEKCGVVGIWTETNQAAYLTRLALASLQHRGQESAGISLFNSKDKISTYKGMGLVPLVLTDKAIKQLGHGKSAIGHNRYGTSGISSLDNAQPIEVTNGKYQLSLGHNGNIPDISMIRKNIGSGKKIISDTILMSSLLVQSRPKYKSWEDTFSHILPQFKGAYSLTILTNDGSVFGIRDPYGIRPLCLGKLPSGWIIASESAALDAIGADFVRDIAPGEIIKIDSSGHLNSCFFAEPKRPQHCIFEYIYFSRPDSFINGKRVREGREESGRLLGKRIKEKKLDPDIVVPVFDSGFPAAKGVSNELKLPIIDAITTSHYIGRTFIQPGQENRIAAVSGKHNIVPDEIIGKKIVVVDDSAVRLTTSSALVRGFKNAGADKVYIAFASPPVVNQCDMGIDMRSKKELPAAKYENKSFEIIEEKIAEEISADAVIYLPIEETARAMGGEKEDFYYYPFGGPHPIRGNQYEFPLRAKRINKSKICVFISGSGTNLQEIINGVEKGDIDCEIVVVSNKEDAYGLTRAKKHKIPFFVVPYKGKLSDKSNRKKYDMELIGYMNKIKPDLIVLAGWSMILGNSFWNEMKKLEITAINLHPALMTEDFSESIKTSRGKIPVLRGWGMQVIKPPFDQKWAVSGVTVHQVLPSEYFDVGPIIMKAEVRRKPEDTLESWEKKIHETEYILLPTAIKRVLHMLKYNIDISKGRFPW